MNTSELLVYIFAFLVGYMLFKRCDCIEGATVPLQCEIDDNVWKYVDENKLKVLNGSVSLTPEQCSYLNNLPHDVQKICEEIGAGQQFVFNKKYGLDIDVSNSETCNDVCPSGHSWITKGSKSLCARNLISTPTPS